MSCCAPWRPNRNTFAVKVYGLKPIEKEAFSDPEGGFHGERFVLAGFVGIDGGLSDEPRRCALLGGITLGLLGGVVGDRCTYRGRRGPHRNPQCRGRQRNRG